MRKIFTILCIVLSYQISFGQINTEHILTSKNYNEYASSVKVPKSVTPIWSEDFWAVGGNDEDFTAPGYEDTYLGELVKRNYKIEWRDDVVGLHQDHPRPKNLAKVVMPSKEIYERKLKELQ